MGPEANLYDFNFMNLISQVSTKFIYSIKFRKQVLLINEVQNHIVCTANAILMKLFLFKFLIIR